MEKAYLNEILEVVINEAQEVNIPVSFYINREVKINTRAKKRMGCCLKKGNEYIIEISSFVIDCEEKLIKEILAHEIIHTCDGCFNHGSLWKTYVKRMNYIYGYNIKTRSSSEDLGKKYKENINYKYVIKCEKCGKEIYRLKKSKLVTQTKYYRCKCGGKLVLYIL